VTDQTPAPPPTVTYWAISVLNSKTFRTNAVILFSALTPILALPEVIAVLSPRLLLYLIALVASVNIVLRLVTQRPVALIAINTTKAVDVPKLGPPPAAPTASD
jgi:hypothetical protein